MGDPRKNSRRRILVIDDEPGFTSLLKLNLEETGSYEVRTENQGVRAVAAAREFKPDLVLMDVLMPDLDGATVAAQIRADQELKKIPLLFLTAIVSKEEVVAKKTIGGYPFIAKPVSPEEVIVAIENRLGPASEKSESKGLWDFVKRKISRRSNDHGEG